MDLVEFGRASRAARPGSTPTMDAESKQRTRLEYLDMNGPKQMSAEGYARVQTLLKLAQARPAGSAKRLKKKRKETAGVARSVGANLNGSPTTSGE